jgi:hypothetical protein
MGYVRCDLLNEREAGPGPILEAGENSYHRVAERRVTVVTLGGDSADEGGRLPLREGVERDQKLFGCGEEQRR